ncbi:MAG: NitT/TauT family transport system substrate-binding protein [Hyphomicrobiales bacterium]|jgi:NitT/TauT family transport system substrate-binding protein|nr:NitT/TauT family transport system substrate-binding protein [Hyphomicrobiales bacterium]
MSILHALRASALAAIAVTALTATARADTITVTHWGSAFYGAPYAVAMAKGFFKKHGLDITGILTSAGGGTSVRNTLAGDLPFGEVALPAAILAINSGQPLKIIGGGVESIGDILWITQPDSKISSIKDLVGKKVSFTSPGSVTNMLILMCLKAANIDPKEVKLLPAGDIGANLSAVINKAVDAGMNGEPLWSENKHKVKPAFWTKDCFPPEMTQTVAITTTEFAQTGGDKLRAIIAARREGVEYIIKNPDESADIVAKAYNGDPKLYREVFKHFVEINYFGDGRLNYKGMDRMAEGMQLVGTLKAPPDWKKMVDPSFLPKDLMPTQ